MDENVVPTQDGILGEMKSQTPVPQDLEWWHERHSKNCLPRSNAKKVELVFLGDSLTQEWEEDIPSQVWQSFYAHRHAINLGFAGDRTEHVLWRIENGELDGLSPKLVVLLIGTNNTGHRLDPPAETATGIQAILTAINNKLPNSKILLLALLPRSAKPTQRLRVINDEINDLIRNYADTKNVSFLDVGKQFLDEKGFLSSDVMQDFLHLNGEQYQVLAEAIEPSIKRLLGEL